MRQTVVYLQVWVATSPSKDFRDLKAIPTEKHRQCLPAAEPLLTGPGEGATEAGGEDSLSMWMLIISL